MVLKLMKSNRNYAFGEDDMGGIGANENEDYTLEISFFEGLRGAFLFISWISILIILLDMGEKGLCYLLN